MFEHASTFKEKGNASFKSGQVAEAAKWYKKAEAAAPEDPLYPSNLSAALYELGEYLGCFQAIRRAIEKACRSETEHSSLLLRLSQRLAKTLSHGVRSGAIKSQHLREGKAFIDQLETLGSSGGSEVSHVWMQWKGIEADLGSNSEKVASVARSRLAALPIFRRTFDPMKEYYSIGQDVPMSIVDDWGSEQEVSNPLDLNSLTPSQRARLAFLFAGVGDARHAFGSLIGLHKAYKTLKGKRAKEDFHVHLTLLDIHPTPLARDLCIMMLLDDLAAGKKSAEETEEIKATIFYIYSGVLVPMRCHKRFLSVVKIVLHKLKTDPKKFPPWIHIIPEAIPGMISSLNYWQEKMSVITVNGVLQRHDPTKRLAHADRLFGQAFNFSAHYQPRKCPQIDLDQAEDFIDSLPENEVIQIIEEKTPSRCPSVRDPHGRAEWMEGAKGLLLDSLVQVLGEDGSKPVEDEQEFYQFTRVFVPPSTLRSENMGKLWDMYNFKAIKQTPDEILHATQKKVLTELKTEWKPNISLYSSWFDMPGLGNDGYPNLRSLNAFSLVTSIQIFSQRHRIIKKEAYDVETPSFSIISVFFDAVVDALKALKGKVVCELIQGDMCQELVKMKVGEDKSRPTPFPRKFMRMWLSNIPDYTHGPLNTAIYIVPNLENDRHASVSSNCLLNTGIWPENEDYCHNYTLLSSAEIPRFLGCSVQSMGARWGLVTLSPPTQQYPLPLSQLATRDELTHWLTRILLYIIAPGKPQEMPYRVMYPNNLVALLNLLVHLHSVGFPGHWLSAFLSDVLMDKVYTTAVPYLGRFPVPLAEKERTAGSRKIFLDPWKVDFENMLSEAWEALPFPVSILRTEDADNDDLCICSKDDIGHYEVRLGMASWDPATVMNMLAPNYACAALLFMRPRRKCDVDTLAGKIGDIVEGKVVGKGEVYILNMIDELDMRSGVIRWRMRKQRAERMKRNGWIMVPIRFDERVAVAEPTPAKFWKEVV